MRRRKALAALGTLLGGGSLAIGSGAFTTVSAKRSVSVAVTDDDQAFLKLTQRGSGERSETDGVPETLELGIPGDDEDEYGGTDPEGVGSDSVYRFSRDAAHDEPGLFGITNQGTQPIEIYSTQATTSGVPSVTIYDVESGDLLTESSPYSSLGVGDHLNCGLEIDTHGVDTDDYDVTLTINAIAPDASD